jgi:hypothetical protein
VKAIHLLFGLAVMMLILWLGLLALWLLLQAVGLLLQLLWIAFVLVASVLLAVLIFQIGRHILSSQSKGRADG